MSRLVYTLLILVASLPASVMLWWRDRRLGQRGRGLQRYGRIDRAATTIEAWVHAASVGEVVAAAPLVDQLLAQYGDGHVAVSTFTATGSQQVLRRWGDRVVHSYLPFDLPGAVARFLDRLRPARAIIIETELWPNLYRALGRRGVPVLVANARLSERSMRGYARIPGLIAETLGHCTLVAAQSDSDAERFRRLGSQSVRTLGNIKFDVAVPEAQLQDGLALRTQLGKQRPVWVAASTHEGEEAAALAAHRELLRSQPLALLIIVPRHPQRFAACWKLIEHSGLRSARRTAGDGNAGTQVLLGDSMGEMFVYLGAADVAFVGGSLVPVGGHNILEPAAIGLPVLFGPHMQNFTQARSLLLGSGGLEVGDAAALAQALGTLFAAPATLKDCGEQARGVLAGARGALQRLVLAAAELPTRRES